jgi:hypothetical protein
LVPATRGLCSLQGSRFVVCRRHPRPCDDPPRRPLPASEAPKQAATHRPPSSAPSGGGLSSSAGKGAVVRPQQQSASVVDLLPKTALVQAARRLADVPSHAMLIFKQQPCSRREVEEEAKKDKSSQVPLRSVLSRRRAVLVLKRSRSGRPTHWCKTSKTALLSRCDPINDLDDRNWLALKKQGSKSTHPGPRSASCSTPAAIPTDPPGPMVDLQPHSGLRGGRTRRRRTLAKNNV